jgi:hypothetical protein
VQQHLQNVIEVSQTENRIRGFVDSEIKRSDILRRNYFYWRATTNAFEFDVVHSAYNDIYNI